MKKSFPLLMVLLLVGIIAVYAQKNVAAAADLITKTADTISLDKGKSFVVQLPVHNRYGDDWALEKPSEKCSFTQSMLGQAGTLPNQPESKLMFFKATARGIDSIRLVYKSTKQPDKQPEIRTVYITIQ